MSFQIYGVNELNSHVEELITIFKFSRNSKVDKVIKKINDDAWRYERRVVHKDTRSLYTSMVKSENTWRGEILLDTSVKNPKSKTPPSIYGFYENKRGGSHAFMDLTFEYSKQNLSKQLGEIYK